MKDKLDFDLEAALQGLREGKGLSGKDGLLTLLIKSLNPGPAGNRWSYGHATA